MPLKHVYLFLFALFLSACGQISVSMESPGESTTVTDLALPDLVVSSINVGMVDPNGRCVDGYQIFISILNQGSAPADGVTAVEDATGHTILIGRLEAGQKMDLQIPAASSNGTYLVIVDPQNAIAESNETNNNLSYLLPTPTPYVGCLPDLSQGATPTPVPVSPVSPVSLDGLIYSDLNLAQVWIIERGGQAVNVLQGTSAHFSPDGTQAILESQRDFLLAEPMDNPGFNITNSPDRLELGPQWLASTPPRIVFTSLGNQEAEDKGWQNPATGYLSMMNPDGSDYFILDTIPSYSAPALSLDGNIIAYDRSGAPMLYRVGVGPQPFDPTLYGYSPDADMIFTSPSFSQYGRWLTWWISKKGSPFDGRFSLVAFDLLSNTFTVLHKYTPLSGTSGWLPNPAWNGNEGWIAYQTRDEVTPWDLWISRPDGSEAYRLGLATNPVWSPDLDHLVYVQMPPRTESYLAMSTSMIEVSTWNTWQSILAPGNIPLGWIHPAYLSQSYFPMFKAPGDWLTYSNANPPYQIQYPPNAILDAYAEKLTIRLPLQPATQMTEKSLTIETHQDTIDHCYAISPWEGKGLLNGLDFKFYGGKYWETGSDGGRFLLGNYAAYGSGFCYTMQLRMTALSASAPEPAPSREEMDVEVLLNILSTLKTY